MTSRDAGTTLVELMVTLVLVGLVSGLAVTTLGGPRRPGPGEAALAFARARDRAVREGVLIRLEGKAGRSTLFLPDGRVLGDGVDPLTGGPADAR